MKKNRSRGQSLFELIIAIGIGIIIVTAIVQLVTISVRNASFAKNKNEATRLAQQALEWLRTEKEKDWAVFYDRAGNPAYWCFPTLAWTAGQCGSSQTISGSTTFTRGATLDQEDVDGNDTSVVVVTVSWTEGGRTHQSSVTTQFGETD
ncbi:MAG: hypothetical protein A3A58_02445 [Candidatus Blackburnbacteria bacterium RIFCSPLOWO2_01_FULL_41_27]|uniref:Type IV pilus modification protein PilV n=2 Tax=Candidatus Blackburniibacteriota TaxID=1817898 RepID=A0A1G1V435_9BACT|nr:MAG: hypothetical protein A3F61_02145 [Candidatus Blackburnbacteria bacterium RIFCSPHIGHO2_12_FULL_41_13b]OGY14757.1 MAG: hypothetical protein A3A58_02445 [Candidatus Blackburnbacteria bacterium RIFCSPLOWO2_01_FULL_41_27]